jgi:uncharacterized protein
MAAEIVDNDEEHRFEIRVEGRRVGFIAYELTDDVITFTEIDTELSMAGQGLGLTLVRGALDQASARSLSVRPTEPFVRDFIARHPAYLDLVPPDLRAEMDLPAD